MTGGGGPGTRDTPDRWSGVSAMSGDFTCAETGDLNTAQPGVTRWSTVGDVRNGAL